MPLDYASLQESLPITCRNVQPLGTKGKPPTDAPEWIWNVDHPYLHGHFAPIKTEVSADRLEVVAGEIPKDLCGAYYRNGPNQAHPPKNLYHYYDGDGMLHAIYFRDGKAWYASKWVRTMAFEKEAEAGHAIWPGMAGPFDFSLPGSPIKDNSNTDVIFYNGQLLSLWYQAGVPYAIDPYTLETKGAENFGGRLRHTLSAHSKTDPRTGELIYFDYGNKPPYMTYGVANAKGELVHEVAIDLPGPRLPHDMGLTPNYAILHDLPFFQDEKIFRETKKRRLRFHHDVPARFGVIPRYGRSEDVRWFEAEPCYILHVVNCWEDGDWVVMDGCRQTDPSLYKRDPENGPLASMIAQRHRTHVLYRWRFNLKTGEVREHAIDDLNTEFPRVNPNYLGLKSRFSFNQFLPLVDETPGSITGHCQTFDALVKYDTETGARQRWDYGAGCYGNEAPFAPRLGATANDPEDDGYIVTFVTETGDWQSQCRVFDAKDISRGPIARIKIPQRIPTGFHCAWVKGEDMGWA